VIYSFLVKDVTMTEDVGNVSLGALAVDWLIRRRRAKKSIERRASVREIQGGLDPDQELFDQNMPTIGLVPPRGSRPLCRIL
jgi:hypothetical protein